MSEPVTREAPGYRGPTMTTQRWLDVAFLHWAVDPARVAPLLPPGVRPGVHHGVTWVGLVPFRMVGAGALRGPSVPWLGTFAETNGAETNGVGEPAAGPGGRRTAVTGWYRSPGERYQPVTVEAGVRVTAGAGSLTAGAGPSTTGGRRTPRPPPPGRPRRPRRAR